MPARAVGVFAATLFAAISAGAGVVAQTCDVIHEVGTGETITSIAQRYYDDAQKWSAIYRANPALQDGAFQQIVPGTALRIPCLSGHGAPDATPLRQAGAEMTLLTGSDYAPFTDRNWPGQGMVTELVNAALESSPDPVPYSITWEDDWTQHLFPMLDDKAFDMGFPWPKPDCAAETGDPRCESFHFSEPLVELLILLFVRADASFSFETDADLKGKRLCRPAGYFTHDLDRADRRWLTREEITLVQPDGPDACFDLLMAGEVDAVTVNEFLGLTKIKTLGLTGQVVPLARPVSIEGLHVVISKKHWRGTTHLYRFNAGLEALKRSRRYDEIVSRHLGTFWAEIDDG